MIARFIAEMTEGSRVTGTYVLKSREMRVARSGEPYLSLDLSDKTGSMPAVMFRPDQLSHNIPSGVVVSVSGRVTSYRGRQRLIVDSLRPADAWEPTDFIGGALRPRDEMERELFELAKSVGNPFLRKVLRRVFGDKAFLESFCVSPASDEHHVTISGLLEHTVAVAGLCSAAAERYEQVDRDMLVTGALLHDVGRVDDLTCSAGVSRTDEGRLVGHETCGLLRVRQAAVDTRLDVAVRAELEHLVLAHHAPGPGSQFKPSTMEAVLLQQLNEMDSTVCAVSEVLSKATRADEGWTHSNNVFARAFKTSGHAA